MGIPDIGIICEMTICKISLPYSLYEQVKRLLLLFEIDDLTEDFTEKVELNFSLPSEEISKLQTELTELTQGSVNIDIKGTKLGKRKTVTD